VKRVRQPCSRLGRAKSGFSTATCAGSIQKASNRLISSASVTTSGTTIMNLPTMPGSRIKGRKAATVVSTEASTGRPTLAIAAVAASTAATPRVMR
jgi:hypothetical protein